MARKKDKICWNLFLQIFHFGLPALARSASGLVWHDLAVEPIGPLGLEDPVVVGLHAEAVGLRRALGNAPPEGARAGLGARPEDY